MVEHRMKSLWWEWDMLILTGWTGQKDSLQPISVQCVDPGFFKHDSPVHDSPVMIRR